MNYSYAQQDKQRKDEISSATKLVSKKHNDFIIDINIVEKEVISSTTSPHGTIERRCSQMVIKIKVDEDKYTAFLLYSNLDNLIKEIRKEIFHNIYYEIAIEVEE